MASEVTPIGVMRGVLLAEYRAASITRLLPPGPIARYITFAPLSRENSGSALHPMDANATQVWVGLQFGLQVVRTHLVERGTDEAVVHAADEVGVRS